MKRPLTFDELPADTQAAIVSALADALVADHRRHQSPAPVDPPARRAAATPRKPVPSSRVPRRLESR